MHYEPKWSTWNFTPFCASFWQAQTNRFLNSIFQPVLFLHGGPGGGTSPNNRKFFDPEFYRIVLVDQVSSLDCYSYLTHPKFISNLVRSHFIFQRGAGKSTPHACLEENTTQHLINDIEKLREHLKIPEWQVIFY